MNSIWLMAIASITHLFLPTAAGGDYLTGGTPADFPGPDGIQYPDWTYAGVEDDIPNVPAVAQLENMPSYVEGQDIAPAMREAIAQAASEGGGAVLLGGGEFILNEPILITDDDIVIRGAGQQNTKIIYEYYPGPGEIKLASPGVGEPIIMDSVIDVHAHPVGLQTIKLYWNSVAPENLLTEKNFSTAQAEPFRLSKYVFNSGNWPVDGTHTLIAVAQWGGGSATESWSVELDRSTRLPLKKRRIPEHVGSPFQFIGDQFSNRDVVEFTIEDAFRGDTQVTTKATPNGINVGDMIFVSASATNEFRAEIQADIGGVTPEIPRRAAYRVTSVDTANNRVNLNQPLRIDYPSRDFANIKVRYPISGCGVENLTIEQMNPLWVEAIDFRIAWNCWVRNVRVLRPGKFGFNFDQAKWCTVRNFEVENPWYQGGGGTAYVVFAFVWDCLAENIQSKLMRHAPNAQFGAQGNVFRNSTFLNSDAQFHMSWAIENLFENCTVSAYEPSGAASNTGYGLYVAPGGAVHGPGAGPRNVLYNNDIAAPNGGVFMGTSSENMLLLHNRFRVGTASTGPNHGIGIGPNTTDTIIQGNVFSLQNSAADFVTKRAMGVSETVAVDTSDATGTRILDNAIFGGSGVLHSEIPTPAMVDGNTFSTYEATPSRPQPAVSSIFDWQREQKHSGGNRPPTAMFTVSTNPSGPGSPVTFDAGMSNDPDGDALVYTWNFGDGNTGSGQAVAHGYAQSGIFQAALTVTDPSAASSTYAMAVTVTDGALMPAIAMHLSFEEATSGVTTFTDSDGGLVFTTGSAHSGNEPGPAGFGRALDPVTATALAPSRNPTVADLQRFSRSQFTIEAWLRNVGGAPQDGAIFAYRKGSGDRLQFIVEDEGLSGGKRSVRLRLSYNSASDGATTDVYSNTVSLDDDTWYHAAITFSDPAAAADDNVVTFYVTSEAEAVAGSVIEIGHSDKLPDIRPWEAGGIFEIGKNNSHPDRLLNGNLDEVRYSNDVLQPAQFLLSAIKALGLIMHLDFEEADGGASGFLDVAGGLIFNVGTPHSALVAGPSGFGSATDSISSSGRAPFLNPTSEVTAAFSVPDFSIEGWIRNPEQYPLEGALFAYRKSSNSRLQLIIGNEGRTNNTLHRRLRLSYMSGGNVNDVITPILNIERGEWYHVGLSLNGGVSGVADGIARFYLTHESQTGDGYAQIVHEATNLPDVDLLASGGILEIGKNNLHPDRLIGGNVDEVKFWSRVLGSGQFSLQPGPAGFDPDLMMRVDLEENDGGASGYLDTVGGLLFSVATVHSGTTNSVAGFGKGSDEITSDTLALYVQPTEAELQRFSVPSFTIEGLVRNPGDQPLEGALFAYRKASVSRLQFVILDDGRTGEVLHRRLRLSYTSGGSNVDAVSANLNLSRNVWYHIAVSFGSGSPGLSDGVAHFYLTSELGMPSGVGALVSNVANLPDPDVLATGGVLEIGKNNFHPDRLLGGNFDEVRFWRRALSAGELSLNP